MIFPALTPNCGQFLVHRRRLAQHRNLMPQNCLHKHSRLLLFPLAIFLLLLFVSWLVRHAGVGVGGRAAALQSILPFFRLVTCFYHLWLCLWPHPPFLLMNTWFGRIGTPPASFQSEIGPFHTRKLRQRNSRNFGTFLV